MPTPGRIPTTAKMGIDATSKWPGENQRQWGRVIEVDPEAERRVASLYDMLMASR